MSETYVIHTKRGPYAYKIENPKSDWNPFNSNRIEREAFLVARSMPELEGPSHDPRERDSDDVDQEAFWWLVSQPEVQRWVFAQMRKRGHIVPCDRGSLWRGAE